MPRNLFKPSAVVPINFPLSSMTIGGAACVVGLGAAETVKAATQMATRERKRKIMTARENNQRSSKEESSGEALRKRRYDFK